MVATQSFVDDPERAVTAQIVGHLRSKGFLDVRPSPAMLGDDMVLDMAVEFAFGSMDGLLPVVVELAQKTYSDTWLDRGGGHWPFAIDDDPDGLLGKRVRCLGSRDDMIVAMLCVVGVIDRWVEMSQTPPPTLGLRGD